MSSAIVFEDATREQIKLKAALHGPGGSGKTYNMLALLHALAPNGRIAVIDTERGRAKKYVGVNGWRFKTFCPHTFDPASLTEILAVCEAQGFEAVGIDSISQYWSGTAGMLDQVHDKTAAARSTNTFGTGWKEMRPVERAMWEAILGAPFHLVATMRVKTDYVMQEKVKNGRTVTEPTKVGMKPEQRDSYEYEMDLVLALDRSNTALVEKSDLVTVPQDSVVAKPDDAFWGKIADFCSEGATPVGPSEYRARALADDVTRDELLEMHAAVVDAGLGGAAVLDGDGKATNLLELIMARGRAIAAEQRRNLMAVPNATPAPSAPTAEQDAAIAAVSEEAAAHVWALLNSDSHDEIKTRLDAIRGTDVGREPILAILQQDDIDVLGIPPETESLSLVNLAARCLAYVKAKSIAVRAALQGDPVAAAEPAAAVS